MLFLLSIILCVERIVFFKDVAMLPYGVYETRLQEIMVAVFIKTNIQVQSKMMNATSMIPCRQVA